MLLSLLSLLLPTVSPYAPPSSLRSKAFVGPLYFSGNRLTDAREQSEEGGVRDMEYPQKFWLDGPGVVVTVSRPNLYLPRPP